MANDQSRSPDQREAEIRDQVRGILERSGAYAGLAAERRQTLTAGVERMLLILAAGASAAVDLPSFITEFLDGVFEAIVDASIKHL